MIAIETIKPFRVIDIVAIGSFAILWLIISFIVTKIFGPQFSYILSLLIATFLMSFTAHLVRKAGAATLFLFHWKYPNVEHK